jgi:hypothetical protein
MRGSIILISFFVLFTSASLLISSPVLPGSFFCTLIREGVINEYSRYFSAILNGVFYSVILWLVFLAISRRLEKEE